MIRRSPRVVVRIAGGLGNQLFMYAAARRLATVADVPLELDIRSGFRADTYLRSYGLDEFAVSGTTATDWTSYAEPVTGRPREVVQLARRRLHLGPRSWVVDPSGRFDPSLLDLRVWSGLYLRGYFQCERYFEDVADLVRTELVPLRPLSDESRSVAEAIAAAGDRAVCIHGRVLYEAPQIDDRADLPSVDATQAAAQANDSVPSAEYYERAAQHVTEAVGEPHFFVFGDHPDAIAAGLDLPGPTTVVSHNSHASAVEDLTLMRSCAHHIICGSTFGWWAAWLAEHSGQVVVAPDRGYPNRDMMPQRWHVVSSRDGRR